MKNRTAVVYCSKDGQGDNITVHNQHGIDYPVTIKVNGKEYRFEKELHQVERIKSGEYYFREMRLAESLRFAELTVKKAVEKAIAEGALQVPTAKPSLQMFDREVSKIIVTEGAKEAERLKGKVVVDTW
jgi:hypothetical protein